MPEYRSRTGTESPFGQTWRGPGRVDHARNWFLRRTKLIRRSSFSLQMRKSSSVLRIAVAFLMTCFCFFVLRQHYERKPTSIDPVVAARHAQEEIWKTCIGLEALRDADECYESSDLFPTRRSSSDHLTAQKPHGEATAKARNNNLLSSYNAILDYAIGYNSPTPPDGPRYTTRRTVKCLTGFSMSVVWDLEFETSLAQIYDTALQPSLPAYVDEDADIEKTSSVIKSDPATSCPHLAPDSSASLGVKINCGFDVHRDAWGHPLREEDHDAIETCTRLAYSWLKGRIDVDDVEPWRGLCRENGDEMRCRRGVFGVVSMDKP